MHFDQANISPDDLTVLLSYNYIIIKVKGHQKK